MNARTNLILVACATGLAAYILMVERRGASTDDRLDRSRRAFAFAPEKVSALRIETPAFTVAAAREDDRWWVVEPIRVPADTAGIARILHGLESAAKDAVIPADELKGRGTDLRDYGLDRPRAKLMLSGPDIDLRLEIGEPSGLGCLYVRQLPSGDILATGTNLLAHLPSSMSVLRNRSIFPPAAGEVRQVRIRRPGGFLHLARGDGGGWRILQPVAGRADRAAVTRLIDGLLAARVLEFVQDGISEGAAFGLDETALDLTVDFDREMVPPVTLQLGRAPDGQPGAVFARRTGGDSVFTLPADIARLLATPMDDLRDRRLVPMLPEDVGAIVIERSDRRLRIAYDGAAWRITEPVAAGAEESRVRAFLQEWTGTRIEEFAGPSTTGAVAAATRILLYRRTVAPTTTNAVETAGMTNLAADVALHVHETPFEMTPVDVVSSEGSHDVRIRTKAPGFLSVDPLRFRDRAILAIPPREVGGLILSRGGTEQRAVRGITNEFFTAEGDPIPRTATESRLTHLASLRAAAWVAENPSEMISYGLDPPAATLTVTLRGEGGLTRSILFGRTIPNGVHASVRGQDLVFLLDPAVAEVLQADLHARPAASPSAPVTNRAPEAPR